jgi:hypothetical protein
LCVSGNPHKLLRAGHVPIIFLDNFDALAQAIVGEFAAMCPARDRSQSVQWILFKRPRAIAIKLPVGIARVLALQPLRYRA